MALVEAAVVCAAGAIVSVMGDRLVVGSSLMSCKCFTNRS